MYFLTNYRKKNNLLQYESKVLMFILYSYIIQLNCVVLKTQCFEM